MTTKPGLLRERRWRLPPIVDRATSLAIVAGDSPRVARIKRLFAGVLWISLVTITVSVGQFVLLDAPLAAICLGTALPTSAGILLAMWLRPATYPAVMHVMAGVSISISAGLILIFGGFLDSGANAIWGILAVLGAIAIFEDHRATFWLGFFIVVTVASSAWAGQMGPLYTLPNPEYLALFNLSVVVIFTYFVLFYYVRQTAALQAQSEGLLRNILPAEVAERLKASDEMIADDFESASVLFADVVGFTPLSAELTPSRLITLLNEVFSEFDELVEQGDLEKIKTVGDAYMVAAGVPRPREDHAHAICDLALAIQERVASHPFQGRQITFRIGISSGPVVAGIIGRKKFSYDLWGDSVNTASRMETFGTPGQIQITETTYSLVRDEFICEPRGTIDVKGKGPMEVWYLLGRRPGP